MLMTIGGVMIATILLFISLVTQKAWLRNFVLGGVAVWFAFYAAMLIGSSLLSEEKSIGLNQPKQFCGFYFDCHLHASVTDVRKTKTIGEKTANGVFYVVKVKIFSDAKLAELNLHGAKLYVIDDEGKKYPRAEAVENPAPPFDRKIPAGGEFEQEVVFDLPVEVKNPRLDIAESVGIDRVIEAVLIGDEDSILHKRTRFILEQDTTTAKF
jgi:hypothetical protein